MLSFEMKKCATHIIEKRITPGSHSGGINGAYKYMKRL